ncbi:MAG: ribosomal-processing cysteine protease Prp [Oscillospiraceae bacterium]|nr:ribosomal-processing cysteine protease Prp [Oscillospiraceae bacterium]MDE6004559.1 ribosomal-processing cysteine protease Prp [Oscillospiraceae bacterium]MDE6658329.1 ribosomal-processing cysteine protease Prp [Oscillospiraceae bacterium]
MIKAVFQKQNGKFCSCSIKGHADYADMGQDIICASVSSAVQLTANLITESFHEQADISAKNNIIKICLKQVQTGNGAVILDGLFVHLQCISEEYPDNIKIQVSEV